MKVKGYVKRIGFLLTFILLITSLGACDNATSSGTEGTTTLAPATDGTAQEYQYTGAAPVSQEKKKVSIITTNTGSKILGFEDMIWWKEAIERANIELEMDEIDGSSYGDVIKPRLAAAVDLPDIVALPDKDANMAYINSGIFIELTEYYEKYGFNLAKQFEANKFLKGEITTPEGKRYYVPYINASADNSRCLMVNTGYMKELGIPVDSLETLDEYYNYLVQVKNADVNGNGDTTDEIPLFMRSGSIIQAWGMFWGLELLNEGGLQVDKDGKVFCGFADPRYREYLTFLNKLYTEGLLYNEFPSAKLDVQNAVLAKNQMGSIIHYISNCTSYSQKSDPDWDFFEDEPIFQPIIPPKGPYGDQYVYGRDALGRFYGITSTCEDPETAFCFMDYLYSEEVGELTWYGFEGTDYNIVNGDRVFTDVYLNNEDNYRGKSGYNFDGLPSYQMGAGYMAKECMFVRKMNETLSNYVMEPSVIFSFKQEDEREIISMYLADINTYIGENQLAFIMGTKDLSEWDTYLQDLEAMHLSEVIEVYQAVADRRAANQ